MSTVLVVVSAGVGGGVALQAGQQDLPRLAVRRPRRACFSWRRITAPVSCCSCVSSSSSSRLVASSRLRPLELVQRLPLHVQELGQLLLAAVGVLDLLGQLALRALDDLLLLAELLGLLFQGVLALVQQALALVELLASARRSLSPSAFCWMACSLISSSASRRRLSISARRGG